MHESTEGYQICGCTNLVKIPHLGQSLKGVFPKSKIHEVPVGPLQLVKCADVCGLVQLNHSFPADQMYGDNYGYRSSLVALMVKPLHGRVAAARARADLKAGNIVLDNCGFAAQNTTLCIAA